MASGKESGPFPHRVQIELCSSWNQAGWVAGVLLRAPILGIFPATNLPKPIMGCGEKEGGYL